MDLTGLSDEAREVLELLRTMLSEERFAYDYTRRWRFVCLTPSEHSFLCSVLGVEPPEKVRLEYYKKADDKTPGRKDQRSSQSKQRGRVNNHATSASQTESGSQSSLPGLRQGGSLKAYLFHD